VSVAAFAFGAGFSCAKTSAADLLVQKYIEKREEIDWKRNGAFASFGLVYLGGIQYVIYVPLFSRLFPSAAGFTAKSLRQKLADVPGMLNVVKQTALDQLVHHPFLYFPAFYATKAVVTEGLGPLESCAKGLSVYSENYREDLPALWKIWVPATLVNFAFSPMWFRIPFVACTSMLWTCILSAMRGSAEVELELELTDTSRTSDTFGSQGRQLTRILQRKFAYQNPANAQLVLTVSGADRAGIIGPLGALITEHGGNVGRSKQITMGSQFCLMIEISLDREGIHDLNTKLHSIQSSWGLHVATAEIKQQATAATGAGAAFVQAARRTAGGGEAEGGLGDLSFTVSGPDRVGIVSLTAILPCYPQEII
jgi:predicted amino acid-binding ACT domain protein